ncbi:hypothetical protein GCM10007420_09850 [Glycocaulis albus]|uniref:Peptidase C-terminal archaeal/bacterial domain-containing protein n=1 Tax=Glycocaulis albus TaxID=1382801 RepID=A0ABQ1XKL8_9PROT|nr:hypothetical protein [Glycocaulis albus]GGG96259.1 hypothetical protein GCM10007420_09850 [Glycocaulis albus]
MKYLVSLGVLAAAIAAPQAVSQTPAGTAEGRHGSVTLSAGFPEDPRTFAVQAGGAMRASRLGGSGCVGFITEDPSFVLTYEDAGDVFDLMISAASEADTALAVRTPGGDVLCDDDGGASGFNPGVTVESPSSGRYEIWVATYSAGIGYPEAALHISELAYSDANPFARTVNAEAPAGASLSLRAGFRDDPASIEVAQGGDVRFGPLGSSCTGFGAEAPSARLTYRAGRYQLYISTESERDGTIAVLAPDGSWHCDDDGAGNLDPGVVFSEPQSGDYLIWAGTFSEAGAQTATLHVSEIGYAGVDNSVDVSGQPHHGAHRLRAGFSPNPFAMGVEAGGPVRADQALADHTVIEGYCYGYITREPTMRLTWTGNGEPLFISAGSDADTLLLVNGPDGGWWCNDDGAGDLNPGVTVDDGPDGVYDIYAATFSPEETATATVYISQTGFGPEAVSTRVDPSLDPRFGAFTLDPASGSVPYELELEAGGPLRAYQAGFRSTDYCVGYVSREPSLVINWAPDSAAPFAVYFDAERDTTLAVQLPDGTWRCNDDGSIGLNAGLSLDGEPGFYRIYAGTYGSEPAPARLHITTEELPR